MTVKFFILRILDSDKEKFNLKKEYKPNCAIYNIITAPEIEMLIIINEHKYEQFKKQKMLSLAVSVHSFSILDMLNPSHIGKNTFLI